MSDIDADAIDLRALRRQGWINIAKSLPAFAAAIAVWWIAYHQIERRYALDDATARNLTLIAVSGFAFAVVKLTGIGTRPSPQLTPRLIALAQARRQQRIAKARPWSALFLILMLLSGLVVALTGGDWDRSSAWTLALAVVFLGSRDFVQTLGPDTDAILLFERLQAVRLGFLTVLGLGGFLFVWNSYSPGASGRFLPIVLMVGILVPEIRLWLYTEDHRLPLVTSQEP